MTGLEKIIARIETEGRDCAGLLLQQAEEECRRTAAEYAARAEAVRERLSAEAEKECEVMITRARAGVERTHREVLAETRTALLDEAFEAAKERLCSTDYGQYRELLVALLVSALLEQQRVTRASLEMGDEVEEVERFEVLLNANDRERFGKAVIDGARRVVERRIGAENAAKICLSQEVASIDGGLVLRFGDVSLNCSLSVILNDIRRELEPRVSEVLFDHGEE